MIESELIGFGDTPYSAIVDRDDARDIPQSQSIDRQRQRDRESTYTKVVPRAIIFEQMIHDLAVHVWIGSDHVSAQ
jgi:hypothetical protein